MASDTTEQFDPYRKWLGIPPKDQPAHHYRLLGIAAFETDPDVIQNAADRQMAHVRNFQRGRHADESQQILNQLAAAKLCLLTAEKKSDYDRQLRDQLRARKVAAAQANAPVAAAAVPVAAVPMPPVAEAVPTAVAEPSHAETDFAPSPKISSRKPVLHRRHRKNNSLPIAIAVICLGVMVVVGGIVVMSRLGDKKDASSAKDGENAGDNQPDSPSKKADGQTPKQPIGRTPKTGTNASTTDKQARAENDKPLPSLFNKPTPSVNTPPTSADRAKQLQDALEQLRGALASRDDSAAATHLAKADTLKQTSDESVEVERLRTLTAYVRGFWESVSRGVKKFEQTTPFEFQGRSYEFVSKDDGILTFKVDGVEVAARIRELAPMDAVAIAWRALDESNAFDKFYVIAFLAFDNRGDIGKQRALAREMLRETIKEQRNEALIAELELDVPAPKPDIPDSPFKPLPGGLGTSPADTALAPVPSAEDLREARTAMLAQLGSRVRTTRTIEAKALLANELSEKAGSESELAMKYELWEQARSLAVEARSVELSLTITDSMARAFRIEALSQKQAALEELVAKPDVDVAAIAENANQLFQQAVSEGQFDAARRLGETRKRAAKRMGKNDLVRQIDDELRELEQKRKAPEAGQDAKDQSDT